MKIKELPALIMAAVLITAIIAGPASAQNPGDTLWTRTYGGTSGDFSYTIQQTADGGYIVTGYLRSLGADGSDIWLLKTDANGDTLWTRTYGGSDNEHGFSVQQTADGGYIIAGNVYSFRTYRDDVILVKTDADGNSEWIRTYGGSENDYGYSVLQTSDGGYIVAGRTNSFGAGSNDFYVVKTRFNGSSQWERTFGGTDSDGAWSMQHAIDGGYVIVGYTFSYGAGNGDVYMVKIDSDGNPMWTRTYGGSDGEKAYSVQQTVDGGYILTGVTGPLQNRDVYLVKTDADGNSLWAQTYGGSGWDFGRSVRPTSDGGYIIAGYGDSYGEGGFDAFVVKTDSDGNSQWIHSYGGAVDDYALSVLQTPDDDFVFAGYTQSFGAGLDDIYLVGFAGGNIPDEIPTLSEWGMLIMGLLLLAVGTVAVVRRRKVIVKV